MHWCAVCYKLFVISITELIALFFGVWSVHYILINFIQSQNGICSTFQLTLCSVRSDNKNYLLAYQRIVLFSKYVQPFFLVLQSAREQRHDHSFIFKVNGEGDSSSLSYFPHINL